MIACLVCGASTLIKRRHKRFCSETCRSYAWRNRRMTDANLPPGPLPVRYYDAYATEYRPLVAISERVDTQTGERWRMIR
jgi:hypothetical protein